MGLEYTYQAGQTPIDENEKDGLLIRSISTQSELNEAEQLNIQQAIEWTYKRKFEARDILSETFIRELHKRMYREVWRWAGEFRKTEKNIGVKNFFEIPIHLKQLLSDTEFWVDNKTYLPDETAIRFKHRIVSIHCFPNGNGRHSRLMADVITKNIFGEKEFTWSGGQLMMNAVNRSGYLQSLQKADAGDISDLLAFARS